MQKIVANNCLIPEDIASELGDRLGIPKLANMNLFTNQEAVLFDLNGNVIWKGIANSILDEKGSLKLRVQQGVYILKTPLGSFKTFKR